MCFLLKDGSIWVWLLCSGCNAQMTLWPYIKHIAKQIVYVYAAISNITCAPPFPEGWLFTTAIWHKEESKLRSTLGGWSGIWHIDFALWGLPCARGTPALRPLNSQQHATTHILALYCIKYKRAALSIVLCSATHALCVPTVTVDVALSLRDKWTPHGEQDPIGPLGDHFRSCCFSVLNGSLGPSRDFMLLPKLPGEHPGSSLGEKLLH